MTESNPRPTSPPPPAVFLSHATFANVQAARQSFLEAFAGTPRMVVRHAPQLEYAPRLWADRHLSELGYGLLASVAVLIGVVAWMVAR